MSTQTAPLPSPESALKPYRLTVRQFLKAVEAGVFPHDVKIELLGGVLVEKMTNYPPHNSTVIRLGTALRSLLPPIWIVSEEKPIVAGQSWRPMPDLCVIKGPIDRFIEIDPKAEDVALVVEVSDSTYDDDRGSKWRGYAAARLAPYWVVNIQGRQLEAYTDPMGKGKSARYGVLSIFKKGDEVPLIVEGTEVGRIAVNDFMP